MENDTLKDIGKRLSAARIAKGYTQEQLSELTNLSTQSLSAVENGYNALRAENIIKVCECLSISADYLLRGESAKLSFLTEHDEFQRLSPKQKNALYKIIEDFLSAFEE